MAGSPITNPESGGSAASWRVGSDSIGRASAGILFGSTGLLFTSQASAVCPQFVGCRLQASESGYSNQTSVHVFSSVIIFGSTADFCFLEKRIGFNRDSRLCTAAILKENPVLCTAGLRFGQTICGGETLIFIPFKTSEAAC